MTDAPLYKVLSVYGYPLHGGSGAWHLPKGRPGKWMPEIADPLVCERGYHLVEAYAIPEWLTDDCAIWEAEGRGASDADATGKTAFAQARLLRRVYLSERDQRLFAADCAEHVLGAFEAVRPDDDRPRRAIAAARACARGQIGWDELVAAQTAAWAAAWVAAQAAARAAARAGAQTAAWAAARAAARAAAWAAMRTATRAATRAGARAATRAGARTAKQTAEWVAAWVAERAWQGERLRAYLTTKEHR